MFSSYTDVKLVTVGKPLNEAVNEPQDQIYKVVCAWFKHNQATFCAYIGNGHT